MCVRGLFGLLMLLGLLSGVLQLDGSEKRRASSAPRLRTSSLIAGMTAEEAGSHEGGPSVGSSSDSAVFVPLSRIIAGDRQNEQEPQIFMCMKCTATVCQDCIAKLIGGSQLRAIRCPYCRERGSFRGFKTTYDFWRSTDYKKFLQDYLEERGVTIDEEFHYECPICCEQHLIPAGNEPGDPRKIKKKMVEQGTEIERLKAEVERGSKEGQALIEDLFEESRVRIREYSGKAMEESKRRAEIAGEALRDRHKAIMDRSGRFKLELDINLLKRKQKELESAKTELEHKNQELMQELAEQRKKLLDRNQRLMVENRKLLDFEEKLTERLFEVSGNRSALAYGKIALTRLQLKPNKKNTIAESKNDECATRISALDGMSKMCIEELEKIDARLKKGFQRVTEHRRDWLKQIGCNQALIGRNQALHEELHELRIERDGEKETYLSRIGKLIEKEKELMVANAALKSKNEALLEERGKLEKFIADMEKLKRRVANFERAEGKYRKGNDVWGEGVEPILKALKESEEGRLRLEEEAQSLESRGRWVEAAQVCEKARWLQKMIEVFKRMKRLKEWGDWNDWIEELFNDSLPVPE